VAAPKGDTAGDNLFAYLRFVSLQLRVVRATNDKGQTTDTGHRTFTIQHPAFSRWNIESGGKAF